MNTVSLDSQDSSSKAFFEKDSIVVVCSADNNYAMPLAVTVCSLLQNLESNRNLICFVIDGGITKQNKRKLLKSVALNKGDRNCDLIFIPLPASLLNRLNLSPDWKSTTSYFTAATYYRLVIPELLPQTFDKAIYLDCDLVVLGDLGKLWERDPCENYVLATVDTWIPDASKVPYLGLPLDCRYFNAGVLLINLKKWRHDGVTAKCLDYLEQRSKILPHADQDVLNVLLANHWGELDPRWNVTPGIYYYPLWEETSLSEAMFNSLFCDPYIVHYATASKPWSTSGSGFPDSFQFKDVFFDYLDMTAWSGWRLTFWRSLGFKLKRKIRKYQLMFKQR
jgi:lipopolysaccharide biosynthesis glycosyltransferase